MQIKQIAFASLALVAAVQAQAGVTRVTGASASAIAYVEALSTNNVCPSNNVLVYKRGTSTSALGNNFTVKCTSGNFAGTTDNEVQFDVTGGSLNAILFSDVGASEERAGNGSFLPSTTSGCSGVAGAGTLSFLTGTKLQNCSATAALTAAKSVGGFMDVEPAVFQANNVITGDYSASVVPATFSQAFAVGVSADLYAALQTAQGLSAGTAPANQPSISRAQLVSIISSNEFNDAKNLGPKFLVPSTTQTNLTYCRRPATSGTQQGAEVYFLTAPSATGALGGALAIHEPSYIDTVTPANNTVLIDNGTGNTLTVKVNSGTGDVKTCLNAAGFAVGFLSAENNPVGGADTYRMVKLNGQEISEGVAGASQTAAAIAGKYDYVFESVLFDPHGNAVLNKINSAVKTGAGTPGVFLNINAAVPESKFTRNGNSLAPYASN